MVAIHVECSINGSHETYAWTCPFCKGLRKRCRHCEEYTDEHECPVGTARKYGSQPTGFEDKDLKAVILNWVYSSDPDTVLYASMELRKRFKKRWPRPAWLPEKQ